MGQLYAAARTRGHPGPVDVHTRGKNACVPVRARAHAARAAPEIAALRLAARVPGLN